MPTSIADYVIDWENLVVNVKASASHVPGISLHLDPMEQMVQEAKELAAQLARRRGVKQEESQQRRVLMQKGRKQAARVRALLKAHFGIDSERLVEFGARPVRPRSNKNPETVPEQPPPFIEAGSGVPGGEPPPETVRNEAPRNPTAA